MEKPVTSCNFLVPVVKGASVTNDRLAKRMRRFLHPYYRSVFPKKPLPEKPVQPQKSTDKEEALDLQQGEWVEVRSLEEINATLDAYRKSKGLEWMDEMAQFCGKRLRVFKRVKTLKLEPDGQVRKLRSPTVFLEGAYCDGKGHFGCDRACFLFWRESWLKRVPDQKMK